MAAGLVGLRSGEARSALMLALVVLTYALLVIGWALWRRSKRWELECILLLLIGLYYVVPLVLLAIEQPWSLQSEPATRKTLVAVWLYLLGTSLAIVIPRDRKTSRPKFFDHAWASREALLAGGGIAVIGIGQIALLVASVGVGTLTSASYVETYAIGQGKGYLLAGIQLIQVGTMIFACAATQRPGPHRKLAVGGFLAMTLGAFRLGRRRMVLEAFVGLCVCYLSRSRKPRLTLIGAGLAFLITAFAVVGYARTRLSDGIDGMAEVASEALEDETFSRISGEFKTVNLVLRETVRYIDNGADLEYGATIAEALGVLIPLVLFPDRPLAPSQAFVARYDPWVARAGGGFSFSLLAEGYLNFGLAGALLVGFIVMICIRWLSWFCSAVPSQSRTLLFATTGVASLLLVRSDFAGLVKGGLVLILAPTVLIGLFLGRKKTRRETNGIESHARRPTPADHWRNKRVYRRTGQPGDARH
jgi:hypothetical protein